MAVFLTRSNLETVFSAQYSLDAGKADESKGFTGTAERVHIIVNKSQAQAVDFANQPCSGTDHVLFGVAYSETEGIQTGLPCSG